MPDVVGKIPEFTDDGAAPTADKVEETGSEQVKQPEVEETSDQKATESEPAADNKPSEEQKPAEDTGTFTKAQVEEMILRASQGLRDEISDLKRQRRESKGDDRKLVDEQIVVAQQKLDDLSDVDPNDVALIEKVLRSKGYVRKDEVNQMTYQQIQDEQINQFLEKYPEYKPDNDPGDVNWNRVQNELKSGFYKLPSDPKKIGALLEKIHRDTAKTTSDVSVPAKKRQVEIASIGAGGTQKSSSSGKTLDPQTRAMLEQGGWSKEEIDRMEKKLT